MRPIVCEVTQLLRLQIASTWPAHTFGLVVGLVLSSSLALSQVQVQFPQPCPIPDDLRSANRKDLISQRAKLVERSAQLISAVQKSREKCGNVEVGTELQRQCQTERAELLTKLGKYKDDVEKFCAELEKAIEESKASGNAAGVTSDIQGDVFKYTAQGRARLDSKAPIRQGDVLETGPNSGIDIHLVDARFEFGGNSKFSVVELSPLKSMIELLKGKVHAVFERLQSSSQTEVNMTRGVRVREMCLCVRGTEYEVELLPDDLTAVTVIHGTVEVINEVTGKSTSLGAGQKAIVTHDGTIKSSTGAAH